ncbi:MAG TPA: hypothetical protein VF043_34955 [Ktedonobacteraceae bacterium]
MNLGKWAIQVGFVFFLLIILAIVNALTFPGLTSITGVFVTAPVNLFFLILSVIVLTLIAYSLGRGIKNIKSPFEAILLSLTSALVVGGLLALLSLLKFPYSVQLNLNWLGTAWYDAWIAIFLVGAPIMLAFVV